MKTLLKFLLLFILIGCVAAYFIFDLSEYVSLSALKQSLDDLIGFYERNPGLFILIFMAVYITATAFSLPMASVLTLFAGAVFGLVLGLILVSFASTIGATLAFLMARFIAKDYIQEKYASYLTGINEGFRKEGAFYLFALRLVPIFPFFVVNAVMALSPIKTWTFYWVSQLGMFAGTILYVYAGTELAAIDQIGDIVSVDILILFALFGLFPLIAKWGLKKWRNFKDNGGNLA